VYIEIVWMCGAVACKSKGRSLQTLRRRQGIPSFMQWDTHYGSSILKPKPKTSLFFAGIKWLTSIVRQFCSVSSLKLLFLLQKPPVRYPPDSACGSRISIEPRVHIEDICNQRHFWAKNDCKVDSCCLS
jgi:hypothetical protein